jgi:hypothetical protein
VAVKCDGPYRIKAHPPLKVIPATFERCRNIFQRKSIDVCLNDTCRPQYISVKGHVLMNRDDAIPDTRSMCEIFLHQTASIDSPRISIFVPSRRTKEVRFKRHNLFTKVFFDPNFCRNTRLLDSGFITLEDDEAEATGSGCKRRRPPAVHLYDDDFDTDEDVASVSIIPPHGLGDTTGMTQTLDGGDSPKYSPSSPARRSPTNTQEFAMYRSPPRKMVKKNGFY